MCDERSMRARQGAVPRQLLRRRRLGVAVLALLRRAHRRQRQLRASPARRTAPATSTPTAASTATSTPSSTSATRRTRGSTGGSITTSRRFPTPADEAHFRAIRARTSSSIPKARSLHQVPGRARAPTTFGWDWSRHDELVHWADIIDGAQFESPQAAVELAEPALQLMTWVENNHDPALKLRFIDELTTRPLAEIAAEPYVDRRAGADPGGAQARHRRRARARHVRARRGQLRRRRRRARRLQQVHSVLPVSRLPLRRRRVADADAGQGVGRLEPVGSRRGARSTSRSCASATAAAAIRWSARCRCRRASWRARAQAADEIAETLRAAAPLEK